MIKRIVDVAHPSTLCIRNHQLCVKREGETIAQFPLEDLGALILSHYAIHLSAAVIARCQQHNAIVVVCDQKMQPCSVFLPLFTAHSLHHKILHQQIRAPAPRRKQLWKQIVEHKLRQQTLTLRRLGRPAAPLRRLARGILSGDKTNVEAQAAQFYWRHLFDEPFRRDPAADGSNQLLNYGYAVVRSMIARALCGCGLHPTIGIFHHNQYNALCLADDLIEPFRPWVDYLVTAHLSSGGGSDVDQQFKRRILSLPALTVSYKEKAMPLMVALHHLMADFKDGLSRSVKLPYPQWDRNPTGWFMAD